MECTHAVSKGMELGHSVTNGNSVSVTVETSVGVTLKEIFSMGISVSATTSFDWSRTDSETFSKVTTTTVKCEVLPGQTVTMQQVVGRCGDTNVYTGFYECNSVDS